MTTNVDAVFKFKVGDKGFLFAGLSSGIYIVQQQLVTVSNDFKPGYLVQNGKDTAFRYETEFYAPDNVLKAAKQAVTDDDIKPGGSDWLHVWWQLYDFTGGHEVNYDDWWREMWGETRKPRYTNRVFHHS